MSERTELDPEYKSQPLQLDKNAPISEQLDQIEKYLNKLSQRLDRLEAIVSDLEEKLVSKAQTQSRPTEDIVPAAKLEVAPVSSSPTKLKVSKQKSTVVNNSVDVLEPLLMSVLGCSSVVFFGLWQITRTVPILEKIIGAKIRFWHVVTAIIAVTALLNTFEMPAHAIFLSGLEAFFKQLATQSSTAGGGTSIDANTIALIFNVIRGVFLLLVAAASLFGFTLLRST